MNAVLISLWLRLTVLMTVIALFCLMVWLAGHVNGWFFYLTFGEVLCEVGVRAAFVVAIAFMVGTAGAILAVPFLLYRPSGRGRVAEIAIGMAAGVTDFVCVGLVLKTVLDILIGLSGLSWFPLRYVLAGYCVAFVVVLCMPRRRQQIAHSLDGILEEKTAWRAAMVAGIALVVLVAGEWAAGRAWSTTGVSARGPAPSGPNILLVTFDALGAEEMSLYGYRLPTTPNIDKFASESSVFTHFYSASTFTSPSIATILTGLEPSEHHVYHLEGTLGRGQAVRTLPHLMRAGGYTTGATINNPPAYFVAEGIADEFDVFLQPAHRPDDIDSLWEATAILHQREPFGSRLREFWDLGTLWGRLGAGLETLRLRGNTKNEYFCPPEKSFETARELMAKVPDGYFVWVHLLTPHSPYLPDPPYLGRFSPEADTNFKEWDAGLYSANEQKNIDHSRLRYDELLAQADAAFGAFMRDMEQAGRLKNTAVIVSADHGESFEGGLLGHETEFQTRPEIHIPLIVRMPGQKEGRRISYTADQTAVAPTLLDIAGVGRPDWMRGRSLVSWLNRDGAGEGEGLAFTQYLATDSIFRPLNRGTVGVIDSRHQYILNLETGKARLRGLEKAQLLTFDRSAEDPGLAETLRGAIYARFPDLPRKTQ